MTEKSISKKSLTLVGGQSRNATTQLRQSVTQYEQRLGVANQSLFALRKKSASLAQNNPANESYVNNLNQTKNNFLRDTRGDSFQPKPSNAVNP